MRILGRIVGVRSTEQSAGIIVGAFDPDIIRSTNIRNRNEEKAMSFEFVKKLPAPNEIKRDFPVPERIARLKAQRDAEIRDVITGKSDKFLAIIGPCSADNEAAVLD